MTSRVVIIIGAPRSGTKILRDALAQATGSGCVPYDVSYVWRIGNERHPDDRLSPLSLTRRARKKIRRYVERRANGDPPAVIEKTVGNSLRTAYVAAVFPEAVAIHLVRDGVDAVESIRRQWTAPPDWAYVLRKARRFPLHLAPGYAARYVGGMAARRSNQGGTVAWGPRYPGIDQDVGDCSLLTVCARQWRWCVESASDELPATGLPVVSARYEDLVADPPGELTRLADATGLVTRPPAVETAATRIAGQSIGRGRRSLPDAELAELQLEIGGTLARIGYPSIEVLPGEAR